MDNTTTVFRYQQWVELFREWSASGLSKKQFCQEKGIREKTFFYYQRRLRNLIAQNAQIPGLPEGEELFQCQDQKEVNHPEIVKIQMNGYERIVGIRFRVNGMDFTVPEDIPSSFLAKLLEASCHGSR